MPAFQEQEKPATSSTLARLAADPSSNRRRAATDVVAYRASVGVTLEEQRGGYTVYPNPSTGRRMTS